MFKIKKCEVLFSFFQEMLIRFYFLGVICKSSEEKKNPFIVYDGRFSRFIDFELYLNQEQVSFRDVITSRYPGNATNNHKRGD